MTMTNVRLRIDELVLEGFPPGDRHRIAAAVEAELARLFAERGVPAGLRESTALPQVDGGAFELAPALRPEQVGAQVAAAIYGGLTR